MPYTARRNATMEGVFGLSSFAAVDVSSTDADLSANPARAVYVGTAGDLVVVGLGDSAQVTLSSLAAGVWHPMQIQAVIKTGTTAAGIVVGR